MLLAVVNSFLVPIEMSFEPRFTGKEGYHLFDRSVDIVFLLDMLVTSVTTYWDSQGEEVRSVKKILWRYVLSWGFLADLMALLGNSFFASLYPKLSVLALCKVVRVLRIGAFVRHSNLPMSTKAPLNLLKYTLYLVIYLNFLACTWWLVCLQNANRTKDGRSSQWYTPTDWINYPDSTLFDPETSSVHQYIVSIYYAVLINGFNELGPVNTIEIGFAILFLLSSSLINTLMFSQIVVLIQGIQRRSNSISSTIDSSNTIMMYLGVSPWAQE